MRLYTTTRKAVTRGGERLQDKIGVCKRREAVTREGKRL